MKITHLKLYKDTKNIDLNAVSWNELIDLTIVAFEEFWELFKKGGSHSSSGAMIIIEQDINLLQQVRGDKQESRQRYERITLGTVMLAKYYQLMCLNMMRNKKKLIVNYHQYFLSPELTTLLTNSVALLPPQDLSNKNNNYVAIEKLGEKILAGQITPIDESIYLTGRFFNNKPEITALSLIIYWIIKDKLSIKPNENFQIKEKLNHLQKDSYFAEAISLIGAKEIYNNAEKRKLSDIQELLAMGMIPNWFSSSNNLSRSNALDVAAREGYVEIFIALLASNFWKEYMIAEAFAQAIIYRRAGIYKYLLSSNYLNFQTRNGNTALHIAITRNNFELAKKLVLAKANSNIINKEGNTPLMLALQNVKSAFDGESIGSHLPSILSNAIKMVANVKDDDRAISEVDYLFIKFLLENGANPNLSRDVDDQSALSWAIFQNSTKLVELLLPLINKNPNKNGSPWYVEYLTTSLTYYFNQKMLDLLAAEGAEFTYPPKSSPSLVSRSACEKMFRLTDASPSPERSHYMNVLCNMESRIIYQKQNTQKLETFNHLLDAIQYLLDHKALTLGENKIITSLKSCYAHIQPQLISEPLKSRYETISQQLSNEIQKEKQRSATQKPSLISMFANPARAVSEAIAAVEVEEVSIAIRVC